jgi:hypothetical protein
LNPFIQHAVMSDDVGRVAGHEQALEIRIKRQQVFGQVPAVHLGHDHVGHEQVDLAGMLPRQTDRLTRRGGSHHRVSLAFEHPLVISRIMGSSSTKEWFRDRERPVVPHPPSLSGQPRPRAGGGKS